MTGEITATQKQIQAFSSKKPNSEQSALNISLLKYETDLNATQNKLTTSLVVSDIFENIRTLAAKSNVRLLSIKSGSQSVATVSGVNYDCISLDFILSGNETDIYSFIDLLTTNYSTAVLEHMDIKILNAATRQSEANLRVKIYSYRGK